MPSPHAYISSADLKTALSDGDEIALLDVREHGQYGEGHPFFSVNCPFSTLEYQVRDLVPSTRSRVVVFDQAGEGIASSAVEHLAALGYQNVRILDGGADGWTAAGFQLFKGVNVPSKAFGEIVENAMQTPSVSAEELHAMIKGEENMVILDGRPPEEYARMNIPTALSCPNAELGYRVDSFVRDDKTKIVINCAGRTRSIIGAQTLINLGVRNPVFALRNGTQGWQLSGLSLNYGSMPSESQPLSAQQLEHVRARAVDFGKANGVPRISMDTLHRWKAELDRSLYIFDVRTAAEYRAGHVPDAVHAPGGQLVQATDHWVATRRARIVLTCDLGPRAVITCYWLRAMGHDAYVLDLDVSTIAGAQEAPRLELSKLSGLPHLTARQFTRMRTDGVVLLDASPGSDYRTAHIVGAQWVIRPRLTKITANRAQTIVVCGDGQRAALVAHDLASSGFADIRILDGTRDDWAAAGLALEQTPDTPKDEDMIDFLFFVHDRHSGGLESARAYLAWERGLTDQMDEQEHAVFDARLPVSTAAE
ncbi:rhodanese-like domain-containing protein [Oryzicola mucosus]|uniref:Sulfurtransferase n=1 Tax=Oryzicola mucosus TaxID=2767425 RepID=A0A8J6PS51_9HYPH|nr:rhodanese-like domain-containing protein [Oryzicola mucosus]MBD0417390.1 sulfurtransferase [Oryzicola mucosus]